ncbi:transcriptional regulator [Bacteroidales bacterium OttesenSCG-928-I14]|nr:transcriptional regulator [Bacteroidales bacterium OttesenSCG-928-I14]
MFKDLNPLLHSQLRLAIISLLIGLKEADFVFLKKETGATSGNLSIQIDKLREVGYIEVEKTFQGNFPRTICRITPLGIKAFDEYVQALQSYLKP